MTTDPPVVLVQSNDAAYQFSKTEVDPISYVVSSLGGRSIPLSLMNNVKRAPEVAIILGARWPQWPEAMREVRSAWRESALIAIVEQDEELLNVSSNGVREQLSDFVMMPVRGPELQARVGRLMSSSRNVDDELSLNAFKAEHQLESLLGESEAFTRVLRKVPLLAAVDATILITGETGTGKELVARALHYGGPRRNGPFVPCNCGTLPDHLFENELFGHQPGAYTDARTEHKGLLAIADGGTLFLDEIDSLNWNAQVKLLRLLQDREYRPLGCSQMRRADVRIMAATNRKLSDLVSEKIMREDLYHRLNVLHIDLPPLRQRPSDVAGLARAFLKRYSAQNSRQAMRFSAEAYQAMQSYSWPGNIRELDSVVQRAAILSESLVIEAQDLELPQAASALTPAPPVAFEQAKRMAVMGFERAYLEQLLSEHDGNVSRAARQAGKDRRTFQRLLRKHGITSSQHQQ